MVPTEAMPRSAPFFAPRRNPLTTGQGRGTPHLADPRRFDVGSRAPPRPLDEHHEESGAENCHSNRVRDLKRILRLSLRSRAPLRSTASE